jgi:hypothetical protein
MCRRFSYGNYTWKNTFGKKERGSVGGLESHPLLRRDFLGCSRTSYLEVATSYLQATSMQRPGVMRAAYFEFKRPSIGTFN